MVTMSGDDLHPSMLLCEAEQFHRSKARVYLHQPGLVDSTHLLFSVYLSFAISKVHGELICDITTSEM